MDKIEVTFNDQQVGVEFPTGLVREYNYDKLKNKPKINGVELKGDVSAHDLGLTSDQIEVADKDNYYKGETIEEVFAEIGEKMKDGLGKIDDVVNEQGTSLVAEKIATVTPQNIGAIPATQKGAVNGVATLDERAKVLISQLPDFVLGQVLFGGTVINSSGVLTATLTTNAKHRLNTLKNEITLSNDNASMTGYGSNEGIYYIAKSKFVFADIDFEIGDWLISNGTAWQKIDNTDSAGVENIEVNGTTIIFTFTDGSKQEFELPYVEGTLVGTQEIDSLDNLAGADFNMASSTPTIGVINNSGIHYDIPEMEFALADGRLIAITGRNTLPLRAGVGITFTLNSNNTISINAIGSGGGGGTGGEGASGLIALSADEMNEILSDVNNLGKTVVYLGETTYDNSDEIKYKQNEFYILADDSKGTGFLKAERAGRDTIKSIVQTSLTNTEVGYDDNLHSKRYIKLENVEIEYGDGHKGTFNIQIEIPLVSGKDISLKTDEKGKALKIDLTEDAKQIKVAGIPELIEAYATYKRDYGKLITYPYAKAGTPFMYEGETIKEFYFNDISYIDFSQLDYDDNGIAFLLKAGESGDTWAEFMVGCVDMSKQTNGQIVGHYFMIADDQNLIARYADFSSDILGIEYGWTFGEGFEPNKLIDLGKELVISYIGGGANIYPIVLLAQTVSKTPFVESSQKGVYMIAEQPDGSVKAEKVGGGGGNKTVTTSAELDKALTTEKKGTLISYVGESTSGGAVGTPFEVGDEFAGAYLNNNIVDIDWTSLQYEATGYSPVLRADNVNIDALDYGAITNGQISVYVLNVQYSNGQNGYMYSPSEWSSGNITIASGWNMLTSPGNFEPLGTSANIQLPNGGIIESIQNADVLNALISKTPFTSGGNGYKKDTLYMVTDNGAKEVGGETIKFKSEDKGKFLVVGDDGSIVAESMTIGESMLI